VVIVLEPALDARQVDELRRRLVEKGISARLESGQSLSALVVQSNPGDVSPADIAAMAGVRRVLPLEESYILASTEFRSAAPISLGADVEAGGTSLLLAAGPCSVEDPEQMDTSARSVKEAGGAVLRGGSFKPRTSPYAFQGLGEPGLKLHREAADRYGLLMMSEVLDREDLPLVAEFADILQVGSRNMQNFPLLKALGRQPKPVLLKRGLAATREEFLLAAEYILAGGNFKVVLCERGVRAFDPTLRHSLDLASVCLLKEMTHLPVLVDPSHATGRRRFVVPMARAAIAAGADGLLVEVHPEPGRALSDGPQALLPEDLAGLSRDMKALAPIVGRRFGSTP
jgi:3-deoxy-7-phosphoheptulonate synthase